jgi:predicted metal-dependent peptidase
MFFTAINIHIVMCDSKVESDTVIKNQSDLKAFKDNVEIKGFGATDFRPVFEYVDELREKKELKDLKGLIYFTDGIGIYPERCPDYDVMFVFNGINEMRPKLPGWAIEVILEDV